MEAQKAPTFIDTLIAIFTEVSRVVRWLSKDENRIKIHNFLEAYKKIFNVVLSMYQANIGSVVAVAKSASVVLDAVDGVKNTLKVAAEETALKSSDYDEQMNAAVADLLKALDDGEAENTDK